MSNDFRSENSLAGASSGHGRSKSVTESPWYWIYVFCTAGLIALLLVGPKYARRQAQIERNHEDRLRAAQQVWTKVEPAASPDGKPNQPAAVLEASETQVPLWPLYVVLGVILGVAWVLLLRARFQGRPVASTNSVHQADPT